MKRAEESVEDFGDEVERTDGRLKVSERNAEGFTGALGRMNTRMTSLRNVIKVVKWPVYVAGAAAAVSVTLRLAGALTAVASAAVPAVGVYATLPGIFLATRQAMGVTQLATSGLSEAVAAAGEGAKEFREALKELPPSMRPVAIQLAQFRPWFEDMRELAAQGIAPGLNTAIQVFDKFRPMLRGVVRDTSEIMGNLAARAAGAIGRRQGGIGALFEFNEGLIRRGGRALIFLGEALLNVMLAARPLTRWLSQVFLTAAKGLREWTAGPGLRDFLEDTRTSLELIGRLGGVFARILGVIGGASREAGFDIFRFLIRRFERFAVFLEDNERQVRQWFQATVPVFKEAFKLIEDVVGALFRVGQGIGARGILRHIRRDLVPVIEEVLRSATPAFIHNLIDLAEALGKLFATFMTETGPLRAATVVLTALADLVNSLPKSMKGAAVNILSLGSLAGMAGLLPSPTTILLLLKLRKITQSIPGVAKPAGRSLKIMSGLTRGVGLAARFAGGLIMGPVGIIAGLLLLAYLINTKWKATLERWEQNIENAVGRVWRSWKRWMSRTWDSLRETWNRVTDRTRELVGDLIDWFQSIPGRVRDVFRNAGRWLMDAGKRIVNGLLSGLRSAWQGLMNWWNGSAQGDLIRGASSTAEAARARGSRGGPTTVPDGFGVSGPRGAIGSAVDLARRAIAAVPGDQVITSTYRSPGHNAAVGGSPTSFHMDARNPAADIGGENLAAIYAYLSRFPHRELINEGDHIHVADRGAVVRGPATVRVGNIKEALTFTPLSGPGVGRGDNRAVYITLNAYGVNDPRQLVRMVKQELATEMARS
jgi:hypothetical protein